ncbi:type A chloramphenicol O-acetyltransferase [Virgibacillus sp. AGTR]|uniref:type A chloramphenicol O-acetyltransferase n=1 Tax=unclassified Virgibacillus TaxID=2620237 RepID=UPI0004199D4A|nr:MULTISPECIES: type A chloramphenicol O-acetyltransferase [Bacillaceae]MCC2250972.1 type A chloramphenicol O-acetyltransferase [Virgibacillus sp. AGTR]QRZ19723.1 type A chloramphenicol O-acetyltransferase [Virgibacillus sp. AGTR]
MTFNVIDINTWERKPYFEHFLNHTRCTFSMTANIDITRLLAKTHEMNIKFYPVFIYMVTKVVNCQVEFRTCLDEKGRLGFWDQMIPSYTIFHNEDKTFSTIWTAYEVNFYPFYKNYQQDMKLYGNVKEISAKKQTPKNAIPISCIPWTSFTGFNLNIFNDGTFLLPIITGGKYFNQGDKLFLPISIQVHHAVCDGYHASQFFNELQRLADECKEWL